VLLYTFSPRDDVERVGEVAVDTFWEIGVSVVKVLDDTVLLSLPSHPAKSANEVTYNRANIFMILDSIGYLMLLIGPHATRSNPKIN
jgi:hypothetical protein